ncbi:uncharacterized protein NPIL_82681 [Nephila pilipes]|uniref:Cyclin-dependent kinase inhibitor domain-containing protein n=1 Tax=Nephila pilipes TaxID=299642 RepID=A0A8X6PDH8_NEPPI|nr:uncharacterized protein NPIL_82681 [Nephila pilipes]
MCTVQVLLFADGMGRSTQGVRTGMASVCRKLFANDSAERTDPTVLLKRMEEQLRRKDTERWNFDFQTETPLPGRYQWMSVRRPVPMQKQQREVAEVHPQPSCSSMLASKNKKSSFTTQSKITDFMTKRKRRHQEEGSSSSHILKLRRLTIPTNLTATTRPSGHDIDDTMICPVVWCGTVKYQTSAESQAASQHGRVSSPINPNMLNRPYPNYVVRVLRLLGDSICGRSFTGQSQIYMIYALLFSKAYNLIRVSRGSLFFSPRSRGRSSPVPFKGPLRVADVWGTACFLSSEERG